MPMEEQMSKREPKAGGLAAVGVGKQEREESAIRHPPSAIGPVIGFIGFGEAAFHIANGLRGEGVTRLFAYDINAHAPGIGERIRRQAHDSEIALLDSIEALARTSNVLLCLVTANTAVAAAEQTAPFLDARHLYVDLTSVSPALKQSIERIIASRGARFVEAAIMAAVPPHGHRVPILLGGAHAQAFAGLLGPHGMRLEVISDRVGAASAVKMFRSLVIKGLEALLFECVLGASEYGVDEQVFASVQETLPGIDWKARADYVVGRVVEHGERRAREMEEVAETLRAIGVEPMMAEAIARRQDWGGRLNLLEFFGGRVPKSYREVLRAIEDLKNRAK
jgi:3-hydroxyisobutyrate dehydrogenase-like beta-hydroxyacid dehydrogenase